MSNLRLIKLRQQYGALFAGETGGWPEEKAVTLIAKGIGVEVDEEGNEIAPLPELPSPAPGGDGSGDGAGDGSGDGDGDDEWKFNAATDPFVTDGVSQTASKALHKLGIHTVDAIRRFIANTPDGVSPVDHVNQIPDVTDKQAEKIVSLYGPAEPDE